MDFGGCSKADVAVIYTAVHSLLHRNRTKRSDGFLGERRASSSPSARSLVSAFDTSRRKAAVH